MKKIFPIIIITAFLSFGLGGCIKNDPVIFEDRQVEFDATSWNANAAGLTYPIIGRIPGYGRVANTSDSTCRRLNGTIRIRINLIGPQLTKGETVGYEIHASSPITTFSMPATITGQTPSAAAGTLAVTNAVAGTHYAALSGKVDFPAGSSFAYLDIPILNPGATAGTGRYLGIKLNTSGTLRPAVNYSELGLVIDQR
ncbi:MAG: hypothetical protein ACT4OJ_09795 [Bacteroidota bacterium]